MTIDVRALACASALCLILCAPMSAVGETTIRPLAGPVIVARSTSGEAMLLWDATSYVSQLVSEKLTGESGMRALEATAIHALNEKAKVLSSSRLSLKVTYSKTGSVSPVYGSATFEGVESVLSITVARAALTEHADTWVSEAAHGDAISPSGLAIAVLGKLPPQ